jgi:hypothetical protein
LPEADVVTESGDESEVAFEKDTSRQLEECIGTSFVGESEVENCEERDAERASSGVGAPLTTMSLGVVSKKVEDNGGQEFVVEGLGAERRSCSRSPIVAAGDFDCDVTRLPNVVVSSERRKSSVDASKRLEEANGSSSS